VIVGLREDEITEGRTDDCRLSRPLWRRWTPP
jgi:hypothetical protein